MTALAEDSMQALSYKNVPAAAAKPSRGKVSPDIVKVAV